MNNLGDISEVIRALGGPTAVGRIVGRSPQSVVNWRAAKTFPPDTYLAISSALKEKGYDAPPSLWRMLEGQAQQ